MNDVHPQTAYRWFREDRMPVPARRLETGTIWVDATAPDQSGRAVAHARACSHLLTRRRRLARDRLTGLPAYWTTTTVALNSTSASHTAVGPELPADVGEGRLPGTDPGQAGLLEVRVAVPGRAAV